MMQPARAPSESIGSPDYEVPGFQAIEIAPVSRHIGAEVSGVDLSRPLSNEATDEIRRALLTFGVIFFRGQSLEPEQQVTFAHTFGECRGVPFVTPMASHPEIIEIVKEPQEVNVYNFGGAWHTDMTYLEAPAEVSVLHGVEIPPVGGDTLFTRTSAAYDALSAGMQRMIGPLVGLHTGRRSYGTTGRFADKSTGQGMDVRPSEDAERVVEHPVVRRHPQTGDKCLYVNHNFTIGFKDMTREESQPLLDYLLAHVTRDEFTCRFRWTPGAVAVWDNRQTMHRAMNDYDGSRRVIRRVTLGYDNPQA